MSAECEECGADLAYDLTCQRCSDKARIAELEAELAECQFQASTKSDKDYIAVLEAALAEYVRAMNIADGELDELRRKLAAAEAELE